MTTDLAALTRNINTIAREAGAFLLQERSKFQCDAIEYKGLNNLVSYVDKETEKKLVEQLSQLLPEAGFITEEGTTGQVADPSALNWIIDPLDGTANFIHDLPVFSVSIGLAQGSTPIAGVIFDPNRNECFSAWQGGGAYCNDERITVSPATQLGESLIATGFPYYTFEKMQPYLQILESLMQQTHGLRRMGSAAIDLAYVAAGRFEAFYEYNLNSWDMAAGVLLVREAGGIVTDFAGGDEFLFRGDVIASCGIHPELIRVIRQYWGK
ncbi:inositol monophosphatase family protein [Spirosoma utsteinense]|uniref:inositol monophosphatase family protein n=1 Tax=Spirosoma utsteinense TaxID=2585773 RepID=UPI001647F6CE|nr:inositol monophosphatase family protein [Spirosoma utsteinense]MBC3785659.1 myo-inositol-1(or 4)-monophosphatase [Spirosoma utsteinense]